jgi:hypothetical protein
MKLALAWWPGATARSGVAAPERHYERGYLNLADLRPYIAARISPLLKVTRVSGQPCKT